MHVASHRPSASGFEPLSASSIPPCSRAFAYEGLTVAVHAARPTHLDWLEEFLTPHFSVVDARASDCRVLVHEDGVAYEAAFARGGSSDGATIDCFALDSAVVRLPTCESLGDGVTVFDAYHHVFFSVSRDGRTVTVLSPPDNGKLRTPLMRVVRELATNHCFGRGDFFLHASAVASGGHGLLITGPKAAGKTTLLLYLLTAGGTRYVANDRVLVSLSSTSPRLRGMPSVVTIRPLTLEMLPAVGRRLHESRFQSAFTIAEAAARPPGPIRRWSDGCCGVTPAQCCRLAGAEARATCDLRVVVFPHLTSTAGGIDLLRLGPEAAAAALVPSLLGSGRWKKTSDLFTLGTGGACAPEQGALVDGCRRLAESAMCYDCFVGVDAYRDVRGAQTLLRLLEEHAA